MTAREPPAARDNLFRAAAWALILLAALAAMAALHAGRLFAIPTVLAALSALALAPVSRRLEAVGAPRVATAFAVVFGGVAALGGAIYVLAPSVDTLMAEAPEFARDVERRLRELQANLPDPMVEGEEATNDAGTGEDAAGASAGGGQGEESEEGEEGGLIESSRRYATDMLLAAPTLIGPAVYGVFLAGFLLAERAAVERGALAAARSNRARLRIARAVRQIRDQVSQYLLAITVINVLLGVATGLVFWAIGMPRPAAWGAAMTLLNYMPYLGPLIMNVVVFAVSLLIFPQTYDAFWPVAILASLNTIEGYFITPWAVGHQVRLGPLAIFIAVAFGAWLWGAAGALIATPALIVARAAIAGVMPRAAAPVGPASSPPPGDAAAPRRRVATHGPAARSFFSHSR